MVAGHLLPKWEYEHVLSHLPNNVHLWRQQSGWMDTAKCCRIVSLLASALAKAAPERQAILLMDALHCHFAKQVLMACRRHGILVCIVPASCTSFLQPLDTDVFARYKRYLSSAMHAMSLELPNGAIPPRGIIQCVQDTIQAILEGIDWAPVFRKSGFPWNPDILRPSLRTLFGAGGLPQISGCLPALAEFQVCFPGRIEAPLGLLLSHVPKMAAGVLRCACVPNLILELTCHVCASCL